MCWSHRQLWFVCLILSCLLLRVVIGYPSDKRDFSSMSFFKRAGGTTTPSPSTTPPPGYRKGKGFVDLGNGMIAGEPHFVKLNAAKPSSPIKPSPKSPVYSSPASKEKAEFVIGKAGKTKIRTMRPGGAPRTMTDKIRDGMKNGTNTILRAVGRKGKY